MNRLASSLVFFGAATFFSCEHKQPPPNPPTPVNLMKVKSERVLYYDRFPATTQALSQVDIRPQVQGYITGIFFREGTHVQKGEKLYEIDERLYQAAFDQAVANVKVAQGNEVQAQQDADRYQYLNQHNAVAKQTLDHAVIALQNSRNEVAAAEQAQKTAATNLTYSIIRAPFDGTIGFSQVKLGNLVSVGTTILNTISTDNPMAVDFLINEKQLPHYQELAAEKQYQVDSLFTIALPDQEIYSQLGRISVIDRAVDPQTGTIRVRLVFPNPNLQLRAGMSCVLRVHNQEQTPQIVIPGKAVIEQMGEYFVFIARDTVLHNPGDRNGSKGADPAGKSAGGAGKGADTAAKTADSTAGPRLYAFQVRVETGQTIAGNIIITSGLRDGDRIVVDGIQTLHDGSPITTANRQGPAAGGRGGGR
jgi:membrane fusion protein (multidrug efflux system)